MALQTKHWRAAAAPEQAAWLRWKQIAGIGEGTLKNHQWITDKLLEAEPRTPFEEIRDTHILNVLAESKPFDRGSLGWLVSRVDALGASRRGESSSTRATSCPTSKRSAPASCRRSRSKRSTRSGRLPFPNGTLMAILFDTGIRKGEARNLTAKRIDFAREQLIVLEGSKGDRQRTVPIDQDTAPFLLGLLDEYLTIQGVPDDYIWPRRPGGRSKLTHYAPMSPVGFHAWWVRCIELADIRCLKPHTTRHTYARRWRKRGLQLDDIQWLLGHADLRTTQVYVRNDVEDVRERIAAVRRGAKDS